MEIKNLKPNDLKDLKKILQYCFGIEDEDDDTFAEFLIESESCLGVVEKDQLAASLSIIPYEIYFNGNPVGMGGIGAVSTYPEHRNKHYAEKLIKRSLKLMKKRGNYFSLLNPFSYSFYRKYGWELGVEYKKYELKVNQFKKFKENNNLKFTKLNRKNVKQMDQVYESFVNKYNGPVIRNEKNWELRFNDHEKNNVYRFGCINANNQLKGYLFFKLKDNQMKIKEFCYTLPEVKKEIFRFIYSHRAQINEVEWYSAVDDNTILMLDDPDREYKTRLGMMWRIIDVKKVLESFIIPANVNSSFTLKVEDPYASWNNKSYQVNLKNRKVEVSEVETNEVNIICSIQALSQLVSGYISLKERVNLGGIQGKKEFINLLKYFVPKRDTYLNDYF